MRRPSELWFDRLIAGDADRPARGTDKRDPPWLWIGLTALFAALALGLGVWGLSQKDDADDARADAKAAQQRADRRLAAVRRRAAGTAVRQRLVEADTRRAYRRVRTRFVGEKRTAGDLERDVAAQRDQLAASRRQLATATSDDDRRAARLKAARERGDLAAACARGTLDAIDRFFEATETTSAAKRAVASLEKLQGKCQDAVGATVPDDLR